MVAKHKGQASVEAIILALLLVTIWAWPVTDSGQNLAELLGKVVVSTVALFAWLWDDFLLQPMVL